MAKRKTIEYFASSMQPTQFFEKMDAQIPSSTESSVEIMKHGGMSVSHTDQHFVIRRQRRYYEKHDSIVYGTLAATLSGNIITLRSSKWRHAYLLFCIPILFIMFFSGLLSNRPDLLYGIAAILLFGAAVLFWLLRAKKIDEEILKHLRKIYGDDLIENTSQERVISIVTGSWKPFLSRQEATMFTNTTPEEWVEIFSSNIPPSPTRKEGDPTPVYGTCSTVSFDLYRKENPAPQASILSLHGEISSEANGIRITAHPTQDKHSIILISLAVIAAILLAFFLGSVTLLSILLKFLGIATGFMLVKLYQKDSSESIDPVLYQTLQLLLKETINDPMSSTEKIPLYVPKSEFDGSHHYPSKNEVAR